MDAPERLPEQDLDRLFAFVRSLKEAESMFAKDRLTPEVDSAWANLYEATS